MGSKVRASSCGLQMAGVRGHGNTSARSSRSPHPVLPCPMQQVIDDQALHHRVLGGIVGAKGAAADAAIRLQAVVVAGHKLVEHRVAAVGACAMDKMRVSSQQ